MTPGPGQTLEERIRDDVHDILVKTGHSPRLAYIVNSRDAAAMLARLPFVGGSQIDDGKPTWFEMHTDAGYVRIWVDANHPIGATHRFVICKCGGLSLYRPGVDLCLNCWTPKPYAPGEKMTDRHPDSVIAQVVEGTIEEAWRRFDREYPRGEPNLGDPVRWWPLVTALGTPAAHAEWIDGLVTAKYRDGHLDIRITARSSPSDEGPEIQTAPGTLVRCHRKPYAPLPAPSEPAFRLFERDGALFVDTKAGPVKITSDPTVRPDQVVLTQPVQNGVFYIEPDPPDLAEQQAARIAEYQRAEAERMRPALRPDGFDQRQIDAAKAALLAPTPPRYARR